MDNQNPQNQTTFGEPINQQEPIVIQPQIPNVNASPNINVNQPINNAYLNSGTQAPIQQQSPMSASQMGLNQSSASKFEIKKFLKPVIITVSVILILVVGWLVFKSMSGYGTKTVQADGFSYSVYYDKGAELETAQGKTYLNGKDSATGKQMVVSVSKAVNSKFDCFETGTTSIISKPEIDGKAHNFCYSESVNAYAMNFTYNDEWYVFTIFPKNKGDKMDVEVAKSIANSVKIN